MPLYEYECESCARRFERIQKFSDPPVEECPTCGQRVRRLVSSPAVHFKGSGWYITDYGKKDSGKSGGDEKTAKSDTSSAKGTETKSDSSKSSTSSSETKSDSKTKSDTKPT